ncbi:hypothetical protein PR202_ga31495 [Eleusine coracana subsp. coracana]|uniref:Uncharacterized protein n=1 Tax=Eleusine coracana subsp. coracana TaxID=191504 RepID=A0AAV5DSI1_ELECO|nr:hypothetical protein PR202_ga31495 [Eleusine coracana subsp. coracana]
MLRGYLGEAHSLDGKIANLSSVSDSQLVSVLQFCFRTGSPFVVPRCRVIGDLTPAKASYKLVSEGLTRYQRRRPSFARPVLILT